MRLLTLLLCSTLGFLVAGCGDDTSPGDGGTDGGTLDATVDGAEDSGVDSGAEDAGTDAALDTADDAAPDADPDVADGGPEWACEMTCGEEEMCCPIGTQAECMPLTEEGCLIPDLTVLGEEATASMVFDWEFFEESSCALVEGCVTTPGWRRLMRFDTVTPNIGTADMRLGEPDVANPNYEYSECHDHFHFNGYADYRLYDIDGEEAGQGHKQAFCLLDSERYLTDDPTVARRSRYSCSDQGIQRGWADNYHAGLDCQWVDVTDVAPGDYTLRITINGPRNLYELDYDNNVAEVPVTITESIEDTTATCTSSRSDGPERDCSWELTINDGTCTPGTRLRAGCGFACGLGDDAACGGDPMVRVCDGTEACVAREALATDDDSCERPCPMAEFDCPASGTYSVMTAPYELVRNRAGAVVGEAFTCVLTVEPVE